MKNVIQKVMPYLSSLIISFNSMKNIFDENAPSIVKKSLIVSIFLGHPV